MIKQLGDGFNEMENTGYEFLEEQARKSKYDDDIEILEGRYDSY